MASFDLINFDFVEFANKFSISMKNVLELRFEFKWKIRLQTIKMDPNKTHHSKKIEPNIFLMQYQQN